MNNVRMIYLDWYNGSFRAIGGSQLAYQYDHLSNLVIFENAPKLDNYYLIVEMKETEDGEVRIFEPIQLAGSFWLVPNSYTQLVQNISFQVCCKTENGDFEQHSAQFTGTILPSKDHAGAELDVDPSIMYDPYKQWVSDIAMAAGAIVIDPTLSIQGAAADAKAVGDYIMSDAEAADLLIGASDPEDLDIIGDAIKDWLDENPEFISDELMDEVSDLNGRVDQQDDNIDEIKERLTQLDGIDEAFNEIVSPNVFNGTLNPGILRLNGTVAASADYAYTDKIPVASTTFIATADSTSNNRRLNVPIRFLVAYDQNGDVLANYGQQSIGSDNSYIDTAGANIITIDENVKYIALTLYKPETKFENISVSFNTSATEYEPYGKTLTLKGECLPDIINHVLYEKLHGKTIAVFGDSIMYGAGSDAKGPADLIAEKYGMELAKYCVSGATMGVRTDNPDYTVDEAHHIAKQVRNAISDNIKPDVIVFNGGTNDIGGNITIGEMSEVYTAPSAENYFANGFETVAYLLKSNYPGVPMIYMRAHNMSSRSYTGQVSYGEIGNRIAEKWGIITADMYKCMNTQLDVERTKYLADYTHPNAAGYERFYIPSIEEVLYMLPI